MSTFSTPGVYVSETPLSSLTSSAVGITAAAFFGEAERGPTEPTLIRDWNTYRNVFGELSTAYDLGYAVYHYFSNGGRGAYVRRVINAAATTASYTGVAFTPGGTSGGASAALFDVEAVSAGDWGNGVSVTTLPGNTPPDATTVGTFTLVVALNGVEVERWPDVSVDPDANRYVDPVVNNYSRYIRVANVVNATPEADLAYDSTARTLSGGSQAPVADSDYVNALPDLDGLTGNLILNAVGKTSSTVITAFINKAVSRGDSFVIIDPSADDTNLSEIQATAANFSGLSNGGYAAHYAPMLEMVDPAKTGSAAIRTTYPGGAVAGLYVRTEVERTVAKAPAGFNADIRGALGLTVPITDADIGTLYDGNPQVNSFKAIPGAGVTVYGARTLQKVNPDKFISVRRTLNFVKSSLKDLTQFAIFEPNDERLWNSINMSVSGFLADFWRSGGLKGARAAEAFYVLCDETNNTPASIDQGIVNVQVGVALQFPAEFIVITLSQWTGGSNAVES